MKCKVVSARQNLEFFNVGSVTLPAVKGEMQLLPGHAEAFVLLKRGTIILTAKTKREITVSEKGLCCIKNDDILIIL